MSSNLKVNTILPSTGDTVAISGIVSATNGATFSGIITGTSFSGTVPSSSLSGALPALDGSALTGVGIGSDGSVNTSGIITATTFVPTNGQLSHRNIIINGAMKIAQRRLSQVSSTNGYRCVDRFRHTSTGLDNPPTHAQVDIDAGTTPYTLGFRKSYRITNGNQSNGAGADDRMQTQYSVEAQDIANSGWNYTSSSSFITLSFWVKSSVPQNFFGFLQSNDGTSQTFPFQTGSLVADTWTKIIVKVPGNSNLQFDNNTDIGLKILWDLFEGTNKTDSSVTLNQWAASDATAKTPDQTPTWYTTNNATFELTGVQLEVGTAATPFEHRSFADELTRCQRYFHKSGDIGTANEWFPEVSAHANHGACAAPCLDGDQDRAFHQSYFPVLMRANPTLTFYPARTALSNTSGNVSKYNGNTMVALNSQPSASPSRFTGYFQTATTHPAFTFQYTANAELST